LAHIIVFADEFYSVIAPAFLNYLFTDIIVLSLIQSYFQITFS
jgi:hypothetical protein